MIIRKFVHATALAAILGGVSAPVVLAADDSVLKLGRREDSTIFDPMKATQNVDFWLLANVFDVLVRVDRDGTELEPGLAESWEISDDGLTYTFKIRDAKFSDGSPITAADAAFSLLRVRDDAESYWADGFSVMETAEATDDHTLVVTLKAATPPFITMLALPSAAIVSQAAVEADPEGFAEMPTAVSGAFMVTDWQRGEKVVLAKSPDYWEADRVKLDGVEWISIPDDNARMLNVQAGQLDAALFVPFARVEELSQNPDLTVHHDVSTKEDHLLINHENPALSKVEVRQALDYAIDKQAIVDTVTFGLTEIAYSYIPKGSLYHYADNLQRPHDPEKAKALLEAAGETGLSLAYIVNAGNEVDEQIAVLIQQQLSEVGITVSLQKVDPSQSWDMLVTGDYDLSVMYWTNDILDPDQKSTFVLGDDANMNYMTRYKNAEVKQMVADARSESDPTKREEMYVQLQKTAKEEVNWIDLYYSPFLNVSRSNVTNFYQNPLGRLFLEDTEID